MGPRNKMSKRRSTTILKSSVFGIVYILLDGILSFLSNGLGVIES